MGIFGALTTAVGGLRANSYALENVSGNIANSQTTAFKRVDTSFLDLIPQTATTAQLAGGVTTQSRSTNSVQGDVQTAIRVAIGNGCIPRMTWATPPGISFRARSKASRDRGCSRSNCSSSSDWRGLPLVLMPITSCASLAPISHRTGRLP